MKSKTLETALLYLSGGCLVISILEIFTQGLGFGYIWLMLCAILFLGYTMVKRKRLAAELPQDSKRAFRSTKPVAGGKQGKSFVSKAKRKRR